MDTGDARRGLRPRLGLDLSCLRGNKTLTFGRLRKNQTPVQETTREQSLPPQARTELTGIPSWIRWEGVAAGWEGCDSEGSKGCGKLPARWRPQRERIPEGFFQRDGFVVLQAQEGEVLMGWGSGW